MAAGGAIESIVINGRRFTCDAEDEPSVELGGYNNEVKANADGTSRVTKTRVVGSITGLNLVMDLDRGDPDFIKETKDDLEMVAVTATLVDGSLISGEAQIVDASALNVKDNTMEVSLNGDFQYM